MIIVYHNNSRVLKVVSKENKTLIYNKKSQIAEVLTELAFHYPNSKIVWCNQDYEDYLDLGAVKEKFHHDKMMLSFNPGTVDFLDRKIGYVDESLFININKKVTYPTWRMSSVVGVIHAKTLLEINLKIDTYSNFDYYLSSIAKICMPLGLLCYSEPKLLIRHNLNFKSKFSNYTLFKFIKQHYKTRWVFLLFLNLSVYERKLLFFPLLFSLFYKNKKLTKIGLETIQVQSINKVIDSATIDIIIPTIGRKKYLYDVLKDLSIQTHLPENVIIVEQNPNLGSTTELDYLAEKKWPFKIKHTFTNQTGACNARNIALTQVESKWLFFADDDIRIKNGFIESAFDLISKYGSKAVIFSCLQKNEKLRYKDFFQWPTFGSGCAVVKSEVVKNIFFDLRYEYGFGEDSDFGMQIRNQGIDVIYFPNPEMLHLKVPIGGFRTKSILVWASDKIQPKPAPTIMLYKQLYSSKEQIRGYKTTLFFKYYKVQKIKNPIRYFLNFQKQWKQSLYWAKQLKEK